MTRPRYQAEIARPPSEAMFDARGEETALRAALAAAGMAMPERPNRLVERGWTRAMWLGPRRVLAMVPLAREAELAAALDAAFAAEPLADVANVSDMIAAFAVAGSGALDVLKQGAALDLSAAAFPVGAATSTEMWGVTVILIREAADRFVVLIDRALEGYLANWLAAANGDEDGPVPAGQVSPPASYRPG